MKQLHSFLLAALLPWLCSPLFSQSPPMSSVVSIAAQLDGVGEEVGAGLVAGFRDGKAYIVTAHHVVDGALDIKVKFHKSSSGVKAVFLYADETADLAVLEMPAPKGFTCPQLIPAAKEAFVAQKKVLVIGHPGGNYWKPNYLNMIQEVELDDDPRFFSITPQAVVGGNSGGPVFLQDGAWLGIVTETSMVEARCVKAQAAVEWLAKMKVPTELLSIAAPELVLLKGHEHRTESFFIHIDFDQVLNDSALAAMHDFWMGKTEVTVQEFEQFVTATGYKTDAEKRGWSPVIVREATNTLEKKKDVNWRHDEFGKVRTGDKQKYPVMQVSWNDANAYCQWLSSRTGRQFRLPTPDEWAYAFFPTVAGAKLATPFGNLMDTTWYDSLHINFLPMPVFSGANAAFRTLQYVDGATGISAKGSYPPNEAGLYDMFGNLSEWCSQFYEFENEQGEIEKRAIWIGPNWLNWFQDPNTGLVENGYPYLFDANESRGVEYCFESILKAADSNCFTGFRIASNH